MPSIPHYQRPSDWLSLTAKTLSLASDRNSIAGTGQWTHPFDYTGSNKPIKIQSFDPFNQFQPSGSWTKKRVEREWWWLMGRKLALMKCMQQVFWTWVRQFKLLYWDHPASAADEIWVMIKLSKTMDCSCGWNGDFKSCCKLKLK